VRTVKGTFVTSAKPLVVWDLLTDANAIPKLYPDLLNVVLEPLGKAVVGQRRTLGGRVGKRLIEFHTRVAEMVPLKRFVVVGWRGGAFEEFKEVIELAEVEGGTEVKAQFDFKVSAAYFGPGFDMFVLEGVAAQNEQNFIKSLKDLSELQAVD